MYQIIVLYTIRIPYEKQAINIKNMILRTSMDFNYIDKVITYACMCG